MGFELQKKTVKRDRSKKGAIDKEIIGLIRIINKLADYYTTSSCAGRIVIIEKKARKCDSRVLLLSHKPVTIEQVVMALRNVGNSPIWFKQEAVIVHVCCKSLEAAERLLQAANKAGLKHSGVISLTRRIVVEIIGPDMLETIICRDGKVVVPEEYLKLLVSEANSKLEQNRRRIEIFSQNIKGLG
jgi:tRNA wybutosine-synthesizing protein 3